MKYIRRKTKSKKIVKNFRLLVRYHQCGRQFQPEHTELAHRPAGHNQIEHVRISNESKIMQFQEETKNTIEFIHESLSITMNN